MNTVYNPPVKSEPVTTHIVAELATSRNSDDIRTEEVLVTSSKRINPVTATRVMELLFPGNQVESLNISRV